MGSFGSKAEFSFSSTGDQVAAKFCAVSAKDRYVLVTGCNAGLGFETCRVLASQGAKLAITARSQKLADEVVAQLVAKVCFEPFV